eukprot:scaffold362_cov246-Pinguiococcus_pyrenoidosus.AAC.3
MVGAGVDRAHGSFPLRAGAGPSARGGAEQCCAGSGAAVRRGVFVPAAREASQGEAPHRCDGPAVVHHGQSLGTLGRRRVPEPGPIRVVHPLRRLHRHLLHSDLLALCRGGGGHPRALLLPPLSSASDGAHARGRAQASSGCR